MPPKVGAKVAGMGRTPEIADEICKRLASGEPLRAICRDEHMPHWTSVYDWITADEAFALRIAHARQLGHEAIAEQCLDIADDERHDWVTTQKGKITNEVAIGRAKLQVDTRLKLLAKWNPKKYGDSQRVELAGHLDFNRMNDDELRAELAALVATPAVLPPPADGSDDLV